MTKTFYDFEDVIVYIDNIILFTKLSFNHHVQHLALVLHCIKSQNLHVHIEQTFLATNQVDYLGYTLSSKGIKPQKQKILAVLGLGVDEFYSFTNQIIWWWTPSPVSIEECNVTLIFC
jgi:hypothetical protein